MLDSRLKKSTRPKLQPKWNKPELRLRKPNLLDSRLRESTRPKLQPKWNKPDSKPCLLRRSDKNSKLGRKLAGRRSKHKLLRKPG